MKTQLMLYIALQYPEVYGLSWLVSQSAHSSKSSANANKNTALRKIIELAVIALAGLINPEAANWAVPVLKFCFLLLNHLHRSKGNRL